MTEPVVAEENPVMTERWDSDSLDPVAQKAWDLVVIGGGTAGIVAAKTAAGFGAEVLLIERERTGGDCLWTGCVPSKTLLSAAHAARDHRRPVDFGAVMERVRAAITTIEPADSPAALRASGVSVVQGHASFGGTSTLSVDGRTIAFCRALVATGSSPVVPPLPGLDNTAVVTSDSIWSLTELPARLLVIGGGSIGCELGQAFARLGSQVTLVEAGPRILPAEDPDAAQPIAAALTADGVTLKVGASVESVFGSNPVSASLSDGTSVEVDRVLVAVGRRPSHEGLNLDVAGIGLDDNGFVRVDARLRTTNRRVWAAGDITGHPQFTHVAGVHGSLAASNAVLGLRRKVDLATIPRVTYTQPEVAAFGVQAADPHDPGVRTVHHQDVDRAVTDDRTGGYSRLVLDKRGRIVGASIVSPRAGESLAEVVLAARHGLRARDVAGSMHAYPTYSDGIWNASLAQLRADLSGGGIRRAVRILVRSRRLVSRLCPSRLCAPNARGASTARRQRARGRSNR